LKVIQLHKTNRFQDEKQIIAKAVKQDREAQHLLFQYHAPKMLSVCRYYIKDVHQAEEAMLNGFFKVFKNIASYKHKGSFEGWIRKIMVREAISFIRAKKTVEFPVDDIDPKQHMTDSINSDIEVAQIQQLIDALPEGYKMVFVMYAIEGYKHHEIAEMLHISEGTSKSQLFKARQMLQQNIKTLNKTSYGTN